MQSNPSGSESSFPSRYLPTPGGTGPLSLVLLMLVQILLVYRNNTARFCSLFLFTQFLLLQSLGREREISRLSTLLYSLAKASLYSREVLNNYSPISDPRPEKSRDSIFSIKVRMKTQKLKQIILTRFYNSTLFPNFEKNEKFSWSKIKIHSHVNMYICNKRSQEMLKCSSTRNKKCKD